MEITTKTIDELVVIELIGSVDSKTSPQVQEKILAITENKSKIILDMTKVTFLSSAGLRVLLVIYRKLKANNGNIILVGLSDEIKDVMSCTGFINFFITAENIEEGMQAIR